MQSQMEKKTRTHPSFQTAASGTDQTQCIIACPIFHKELESVLAELNLVPTIHYMHYTIHINPLMMEEELQANVGKAKTAGQKACFLVGKNCKGTRDIEEVVQDCNGKIPHAMNCIDMLIGDELVKKLQEPRTSLMTPAWIKMIAQSFQDGQWSVTEARMNLGWYNKIIILDTGVEPLDDEQIMEFYDLIQVEIDIVPIELEHFKSILQDLLQ